MLPVLLCSPQAAARGDGSHPLDRVRMQKAIFLLIQRGPAAWRSAYTYRPYNWGPYCGDLSHDVNRLIESGVIRLSHADGATYGRYQLTEAGEAVADDIWATLGPEEQDFLSVVRSYVTHKDFNGLLREVYKEYPEYATKSRWSGKE